MLYRYFGRFDVYSMAIFTESTNVAFLRMSFAGLFRHEPKMENALEFSGSPRNRKVFSMVYCVENVSW